MTCFNMETINYKAFIIHCTYISYCSSPTVYPSTTPNPNLPCFVCYCIIFLMNVSPSMSVHNMHVVEGKKGGANTKVKHSIGEIHQ